MLSQSPTWNICFKARLRQHRADLAEHSKLSAFCLENSNTKHEHVTWHQNNMNGLNAFRHDMKIWNRPRQSLASCNGPPRVKVSKRLMIIRSHRFEHQNQNIQLENWMPVDDWVGHINTKQHIFGIQTIAAMYRCNQDMFMIESCHYDSSINYEVLRAKEKILVCVGLLLDDM